MPVLLTFIVVSAAEVVVVDVLVQRWPAVRIPLLVVGIWGVIWMCGLLFGMVTRLHADDPRAFLDQVRQSCSPTAAP
ncbi:hypothetical protein [Geodermatophilus sp. CPCC 206100]|uniref:hypothetical protein n=1 Tax=Geodermatophilus sp. CPCC 206100 TaxID=3020054 RepID=UPI003B00759C